ncbi:MAG TPA: GSCFA domain-containing protein [Candidatus Rubrimentiphilum sp.]|nr:GSCFA domain-containing protein [Candidatus Rubrimentiphilum sp.]
MSDPGDRYVFPYANLADYQNWRKAVEPFAARQIDPQGKTRFKIDRVMPIASAGSCFARRIAQSLRNSGFNYYDAEAAPAWLSSQQRSDYNYGIWSARFGDVFTTLQLLQLLQRAIGEFEPVERFWIGRQSDEILDPFRPRIQPNGFRSIDEMEAQRAFHLQAVQRLFNDIDVFIFTMGLTETWCHLEDGAAYPVCPGRGIGTFDASKYRFRNLTVAENIEYLGRFLEIFRRFNPRARVILSVSPVPLAATFEDRHVITSTTYTKAVLRVAAEEIRRSFKNVDYFASYELVMGTLNAGEYFQPDRRHINSMALDLVMTSFYRNFSSEPETMPNIPNPSAATANLDPCDEDLLLEMIERDSER